MCPFKNVPLGQFIIIIGGKVNHHLFPCPLNMSISEQTHVTSLKVKPTRHTTYFYQHTHTTRATEVQTVIRVKSQLVHFGKFCCNLRKTGKVSEGRWKVNDSDTKLFHVFYCMICTVRPGTHCCPLTEAASSVFDRVEKIMAINNSFMMFYII